MSLYQKIAIKTLIEKGWSGDRKYRVTTHGGRTWLLRVSPLDRQERKIREFAEWEKLPIWEFPCASL